MLTEVFKKGDRVFHFAFGWGEVTGDSEKGVCDVVFENRESATIPCKEMHLSFCEYDLVAGGLSHERPFELEVGKSYKGEYGATLIINRIGKYGNYGFQSGQWTENNPCRHAEQWREATDEEVRSALEKETIRRFGENWKDVKIKRAIYDVDEDCINMGIYDSGEIDQDPEGWYVCGKNGHLFYKGVWAEKVEEPELKPFQKVLVRDFYENEWKIDFFSHMMNRKYICLTSYYRYCIPYEGNEHLLGTTKSPGK